MSPEEENKKIKQLLVIKGILSLKQIDELLPQYNEFFDGPLLEWLQQQKFLNATQVQTIRHSLQELEEGQTIQIDSQSTLDSRVLTNLVVQPPSSGTLKAQTPPSGETTAFAQITQLPRTLGSYQILEKLGEGGMGKVFKAKHLFLEKWVAFKVLNERLLQNQKFIARFFREAKSAGALNHPNIVRCLDAGVLEGLHYLAMEFVEGETISSLLRQRKLAPEESLHIILKILSALEHAQSHGMIHRDLKPDNIMISREGEVKLLDFGLAKIIGDSSLTLEGAVLGTPYYMSPEQARGESDVTIAADLYALGATLFHMLSGSVPYVGDSPLKVIRQHLEDPVPSLRAKVPTIDPRLEALIEKLMAKNPKNRYQTPGEVRLAIFQILSTPPPSSSLSSKDNPIWEEKTVFFESPNPSANTSEWKAPPPNLPAPSTSKFTLPKNQEPPPPTTSLKAPSSNPSTFSYKTKEKELEKKVPSTEALIPEREEESFVAPFPTAKKKDPQVSGFVPGSQLYHGNWKPPASDSNLKTSASLRPKKKRNPFLVGILLVLLSLGVLGALYPEQIKGYWGKASASVENVKVWFSHLLESNEVLIIDVVPPDSAETETKKLPPAQLKIMEEIQQLRAAHPPDYKEIHKKYQTIFKQFPDSEITLKKEWDDFIHSYEKVAKLEFQNMESLDFIAKNLFLYDESIQRWTTYANSFEPLLTFHRMGNEQTKHFQDLKLSAGKKNYFLLNKGLEPLWKAREDFEHDWQKIGGDSKSYQISQTILCVDLDKRAKEFSLIYNKLFPLNYLLSFKANIKAKGFEFLLHYASANSFNAKLFSKENHSFSDSQWYVFRFYVHGRLLTWYIFTADKENKCYVLFAQGEEQFKISTPDQGQWGFRFSSASSCNFDDMRFLKLPQK